MPLLLGLIAAGAAATDTPAAGPADSLPSVIIEARRQTEQQRAKAFVEHVIAHRGDESYPVWREPVCLHMFGVTPAQEEFFRRRLTEIITAAGAPLGAGSCRANFHVVVSAHADQLVEAWTTRNDGFAAAGWHAEKRLLEQPRPVRVWYGVDLASADGTPLGNGCPGQGQAGEVRVNCSAFATRLQFNELTRFHSLVVIVDQTRVSDFNLGQLVDYIGLIGLTRINLDAPLHGEPTLLSLFRVPREDRLQGLSEWDQAFLAALYHTNLAVRGQDADIASSMARALVH